MDRVASSREFFDKYGLTSSDRGLDCDLLTPGIQFQHNHQIADARDDFLGLDFEERYSVFRRLLQQGSGRDFLRIIYLPASEPLSPSGCLREKSAGRDFLEYLQHRGALGHELDLATLRFHPFQIDLARDGRFFERYWNSHAFRGISLWERRFEILKTLFLRQEQGFMSRRCDVEYSESGQNRDFFNHDRWGSVSLEMMKKIYGSDPELFDTDQDSVFDDQDRFPLDNRFSADRDHDLVPDPVDIFPKDSQRWHNLSSGERRERRLPTGELVYSVSREGEVLFIELPVWIVQEDGSLPSAEIQIRIRESIEGYFETQLPSNLRMRFLMAEDQGVAIHRIQLVSGTGQDHTGRWFLGGQWPHLRWAHEVGHLLGLRDRYPKAGQGASEPDWDFSIGYRFRVGSEDLMSFPTREPRFYPQDALLVAALATAAPQGQFFAGDEGYYVGLFYSMAPEDNPPKERRYYQGYQDFGNQAQERFRYLLEGQARRKLASLESDPQKKLEHLRSALSSFLKDAELNPIQGNNRVWIGHTYRDLAKLAPMGPIHHQYYRLSLDFYRDALGFYWNAPFVAGHSSLDHFSDAWERRGGIFFQLAEEAREANEKRGLLRRSLNDYERSAGIFFGQQRESVNPRILHNIAICYSRLGDLAGDIGEKRRFYELSVKYAEQAFQRGPTQVLSRQLADQGRHRLEKLGRSGCGGCGCRL